MGVNLDQRRDILRLLTHLDRTRKCASLRNSMLDHATAAERMSGTRVPSKRN